MHEWICEFWWSKYSKFWRSILNLSLWTILVILQVVIHFNHEKDYKVKIVLNKLLLLIWWYIPKDVLCWMGCSFERCHLILHRYFKWRVRLYTRFGWVIITKVRLPFSFLKSLHSGKITQFGHDLSFEIMLTMFIKTWFGFF